MIFGSATVASFNWQISMDGQLYACCMLPVHLHPNLRYFLTYTTDKLLATNYLWLVASISLVAIRPKFGRRRH